MIQSDALQILRENVGIVAGDTYTYDNTILLTYLENSRAYVAERSPVSKIPRCQVQGSATLISALTDDYRAFQFGVRLTDLEDNTSTNISGDTDILNFSPEIQIEDVSTSINYNGRLYTDHISAMIETHRWSLDQNPNENENYVPVLYDSVWFQIRSDFAPVTTGWSTSDKMYIRVTVRPDPLSASLEDRRLPERYENYAIQLAYADIMLTAVGDLQYRDIKADVLRQIGIIRSGVEL